MIEKDKLLEKLNEEIDNAKKKGDAYDLIVCVMTHYIVNKSVTTNFATVQSSLEVIHQTFPIIDEELKGHLFSKLNTVYQSNAPEKSNRLRDRLKNRKNINVNKKPTKVLFEKPEIVKEIERILIKYYR